MFSFLRSMKSALAGQNEKVMSDLSSMNMKIDSINNSICDLKKKKKNRMTTLRELILN